MSTIIDTLITDRTADDVSRVAELTKKGYDEMTESELTAWIAGMKGAYNANDLNRVGTALNYLRDRLRIICGKHIAWQAKTDYKMTDVINAEQADEYAARIQSIRAALEYPTDSPTTPSIRLLTYIEANEIERILQVCEQLIENVKKAFRYTNAAECAIGGLI